MLTRVNRVLVTNKEGAAASTSINAIATGDIVPFNGALAVIPPGGVITSNAANDILQIAIGNEDGSTTLSSPIQVRNITKVTVQGYVAPAEKVMTIGYNGTSGTITSPSPSQEWRLIVDYLDDQRFQNQRISRGVYNYVSDSTPTTLELVSGVVGLANKDLSSRVKVEMIVNQAGVLVAETATAVYDSNQITTSAAPTFSVGDVIRISANTTTTGAYRVTAIVGNVVTLSSKFQGASGSALPIATVGGITLYGIKITGIKIPYNGIDFYQKVNFDCFLAPVLGPTNNAEAKQVGTEISYGQGYWQEIRDAEYLAKAFYGDTNQMMFPVKNIAFNTKLNNESYGYRMVTIESFDKHQGDLQGVYSAPIATNIVFKTETDITIPIVNPTNVASAGEIAFLAVIKPLVESVGVFVQ